MRNLFIVACTCRGCIRSLELDGRQLGLREARVTRKIAADCQWQYACASNPTPCVDGAQCSQEGLDDFRCEGCSQASCVRPDYVQHHYTTTSSSAVTNGNSGVDDAQLATVLSLTPVQVCFMRFHCFFNEFLILTEFFYSSELKR